MINSRILDLLKDPKSIQSDDLLILKKEINAFPYMQSIRAIHLYGVHLHDRDQYQKELSVTAAYTTDKKILYQLINGKIMLAKKADPSAMIDGNQGQSEAKSAQSHVYEGACALIAQQPDQQKTIYVKGVRNRILYEGEENFLEDQSTEVIDVASTIESGVIVTQKTEKTNAELPVEQSESDKESDVTTTEKLVDIENTASLSSVTPALEQNNKTLDQGTITPLNYYYQTKSFPIARESTSEKTEDLQVPPSETIIHTNEISDQKTEEIVQDDAQVSFHQVDSFPAAANFDVENEHLPTSIKIEDELYIDEKQDVQNIPHSETLIEEDEITFEKAEELVQNDTELSFHATEAFFPEVKIESAGTDQKAAAEAPTKQANHLEDEMRKLIEQVEKKMKEQKKEPVEETPLEEEDTAEISFAETQDFVVESPKKEDVATDSPQPIAEDANNDEMRNDWKPMNFDVHAPDTFSRTMQIDDQNNTSKDEIAIKEEVLEQEEVTTQVDVPMQNINSASHFLQIENSEEKTSEEAPVMNVSFFGTEISTIALDVEKDNKYKPSLKADTKESTINEDSNVPGFINTWQSWLKIDRSQEVQKVKAEIKTKAIESFIENNPRISQLKDEVNFVVKEKNDDISHLMTETLANIYAEQKLYSKAIKAFEVLIQKHPDRKDYFKEKIQEIKDNKGKN